MELDWFKDKVVFITGASSGIGQDAAVRFAALGCHVVLNGRNDENLRLVADLCRKGSHEGKVLIAKADVSKEAEVKKAIQLTIRTFHRLDILVVYTSYFPLGKVNNAGIQRYGSILDVDMSQYDEVMDCNLRSVVMVTKYAVPHLIESKGCIVNVSSISGICSMPGELCYAMSKSAMDQFTKCTAMELAAKGIRVNSVNPGVVRTNIHYRAGFTESRYQQYLHDQNYLHPLGRYGKVTDTSSAIVFLASPAAAWITGVILPVDGGRILVAPTKAKL